MLTEVFLVFHIPGKCGGGTWLGYDPFRITCNSSFGNRILIRRVIVWDADIAMETSVWAETEWEKARGRVK
jgi:hypothetical protein